MRVNGYWSLLFNLKVKLFSRNGFTQTNNIHTVTVFFSQSDLYTNERYTYNSNIHSSPPNVYIVPRHLQTPNPSSPALPKSCTDHVRPLHVPIIAPPPIVRDVCWHNTRDVTRINLEVSFPGIEPVTRPFKGRCSTNWATNRNERNSSRRENIYFERI